MWGVREKYRKRVCGGKRVTEKQIKASPWCPVFWSCSSGLLGGESPAKHRIQWINILICLGMPRYLPWEGKFDRVSFNRFWICCITLHHVQPSSAQWKVWGISLRGALRVLDVLWHLLSHIPRECPTDVAVLGWGLCAWASLCEGRGCSLPVTRGFATQPKLSSSPLAGGQCVQIWPHQMSPWAVTFPTLNPARNDFQDRCWAWLSLWMLFSPSALFNSP